MDTGIVNIHGKDYKTVAKRIEEFRKDHPDWCILTEIVEKTDDTVVMKATIYAVSSSDLIKISSGHAEEWKASSHINKTSYVENCETSAVGRALAFCGYAGSEIASADEIEIAKRKEQAMKAPRWNEDKATVNEFLDGVRKAYPNITIEQIEEALGCSVEEYEGSRGGAGNKIKKFMEKK